MRGATNNEWFMNMTMVIMGVTMIKVQRKTCREMWRCALALFHVLTFASKDMVNPMIPIVSMIGDDIAIVCKHTLSQRNG